MSDNMLPPPGGTGDTPAPLWPGEAPPVPDPAAFVSVVRKKIHRRTATNQLSAFSWTAPGLVLLGLVNVMSAFFHSFAEGRRRQ